MGGIVGEKVCVEDYADAVDEVGVDTGAFEDVVDVAAVAVDLLASFLTVSCHINCIFLRIGLQLAQ